MADSFDPLDFISSNAVTKSNNIDFLERADQDTNNVQPLSDDFDVDAWPSEGEVPIQPLDLPCVQYAAPDVILTVLKLLQPATQVNFKSAEGKNDETWEKMCNEKGVTESMLQLTLKYYEQWINNLLRSYSDLCTKIPALYHNRSSESELLNYFTTILSKYETSSNELANQILQQASSRISERCGRTAQPSMTRTFKLEGLDTSIKLYEPALTSDNLGLKTWGSSLMLSQKIIGIPAGKRVLELGSGTGLVGISYALTHSINGDSVIFLTDLPEILPNLQYNVRLNNLNDVTADVLDWTDPLSFTEKYGNEPFDTIVIADPIYSPQHPIWLVDMIVKFLSENGKVYLQIPIRPKYESERELLWKLLEENDLNVIAEVQEKGKDDWGDVDYLYKEITRLHTL
ncbi:S-adenosylmethionine-dependent methyltransferase [Kluyveromyces lactis]|uniref:KLLA0E21539p n=1 Tax=Kluyveromyces lactis (strain ATCC 8585 / CBS 2359 / DSM 70799 / NBRC 1267 / NRRL Y-1140 / WM37) TaxID=284590 RepID=Q6CMB4_KLULA|nr:uncharacterized protein KLLA0_E21539g [Kluyveromyces lactis]CAH00012.1 KLLA0E21539p [Kluyveromyces lactis]|eukprot:XP_454925.1 uncharacterized protein KLLA0_E21539g [Kluyveromyces lactis]